MSSSLKEILPHAIAMLKGLAKLTSTPIDDRIVQVIELVLSNGVLSEWLESYSNLGHAAIGPAHVAALEGTGVTEEELEAAAKAVTSDDFQLGDLVRVLAPLHRST